MPSHKFKESSSLADSTENDRIEGRSVSSSKLPARHNGPSFTGNPFSLLYLLPSLKVLKVGAKAKLNYNNYFKLRKKDSVRSLCKDFDRLWEEQLESKEPSLFAVLEKICIVDFILCMLLLVINAALQYNLPLLLPYVIDWLMSNNVPTWWMYLYSGTIFLANCSASIASQHAQLQAWRLGLRIRSCLVGAIYKKALKVRPNRYQTSGMIVNYMSTDCQIILDTFSFFLQGCISPAQIAITVGLLSMQIGPFSAISLGLSILILPLTGFVTKKLIDARHTIQKAVDIRIKLVKEFLFAIRIIKYYAWEKPFSRNIAEAREIEIIRLKKMFTTRLALIFLLFNVPGFGVGFTFFFYGLGHTLELRNVFTSLALLNLLRVPFMLLPISLTFFGQYTVSLRRIQKFLLQPELRQVVNSDEIKIGSMLITNGDFSWETKEDIEMEQRNEHKIRKEESKIERQRKRAIKHLDKGTEQSEQKTVTSERRESGHDRKVVSVLSNINLKVDPGTLTMIVGSVGSGKSSLVGALLHELSLNSGTVLVNGSIAYAAQDSWIFNGTIRENVLFGKPFDQTWYEEVINASTLSVDLKLFPTSDMTEIGERGTNLSGGQRQRISIARAMYSRSDIVILDDPLSAVDPHVAELLFKNVILAMHQANRTVFLVTNQLYFLPHADHIVLMKKGRIVDQGTYRYLLTESKEFIKLQKSTKIQVEPEGSEHGVDYEVQEQIEKLKHAQKTKEFKVDPKKDEENKRKGLLVQEEHTEEGGVSFETLKSHILMGGVICFITAIFFLALSTASRTYGSIWLSDWANPLKNDYTKEQYLGVYMGLVLGESIMSLGFSFFIIVFTISVSRKVHHGLFHSISRAPVSWYDSTPIGRILTRFSNDINIIDTLLTQQIEQMLNIFFQLLGIIINICIGTPLVSVIVVIAGFLFVFVIGFYRRTSIQIQRQEAITRSPIFVNFTESLDGAATIRAYKLNKEFEELNKSKVELNVLTFLTLRYCAHWFGLTLDFLGNIVVLLTFLTVGIIRIYIPGFSDIGFMTNALSSSGSITQTLAQFSLLIADVETKLNSIERVLEYMKLPEEPPDSIEETKPSDSWPHEGHIMFDNVSLEYTKGVPVLNNISLEIKPCEKIGIVGRTGAGKTTLVTALFRITELSNGRIIIDGVDISSLGVHDLRSKLSIIPQTPTMFTGTLRYNLDPLNQYTDEEIWRALKLVKLDHYVKTLDGGLFSFVDENGSNFSAGQRQLLSMERCILRNAKVLLLDEATAAVDTNTDAQIQKMIRKLFKDVTVLTIAHRLDTIMDNDRILVLDRGKVVEFDKPSVLLKNPAGYLYNMVEATGPETSQYLRDIANGEKSVVESIKAIQKLKKRK
ncbi:ABC transporter C family member 3-like [Schistocerca gregaria]|uniref:ABC transporter C family member 3-like n=1 Tax=Schistocerca gregaria TaxID=7010 RepID=UPI00211EE39C|nr:ABC transporter C family member 3-like [Schistocerca gregaria]